MPYKWTFWDEVLQVFLDASPSPEAALSSFLAYLTSKPFDPRHSIQESSDEGETRSSHLPEIPWDFGYPSDFSKQDFKAFQNSTAEKNK